MPWPALRSLSAIARYGTLTAAARAQGYTPGAVSQQLDALERAVGRPVLARVGRHVQLTDAGRLLVRHADVLLGYEQDARAAVMAIDREISGSVTVATFATFAAALLPRSIELAAIRHPGLSIRTLELDVDEVAQAVRYGDADLAFGLDYPDAPVPHAAGTEVLPVASERLSVATVGACVPETGRSLAAFADHDWILPPENTNYGRAMRDACRRAGFEPRASHIVNDTAVTLMLASRGLGVTMTSPMMLALQPAPNLVHIALEQDVRRELILFQRSSTPRRPTVEATREIIDVVVQGFVSSSERPETQCAR